jgi:hypothetical protein
LLFPQIQHLFPDHRHERTEVQEENGRTQKQ